MAQSLLTLTLMGTLALLWSIVDGYQARGVSSAVREHFLYSLVSTLFLVMGHSFIMFFLIATGVELKDMEKERGWGDSFRRRTIALKGRVFPVMTLALVLVIANFVLGAATHTRVLPPLVHEGLAWLTFAVCLVTLWREHQVLGENNRLIAEAGARRQGA